MRPLFRHLERILGVGLAAPSDGGAKAGRQDMEPDPVDELLRHGKRRRLTHISLSEMRAFRARRRARMGRAPSVARLIELATRPSRTRGILAVALGLIIASNAGLSIPVVCLLGLSWGLVGGVALAAASIVVSALPLVDPLSLAAWETALLGILLIAGGSSKPSGSTDPEEPEKPEEPTDPEEGGGTPGEI